jgi:O-antigen ligase/tetratricopeptide (TPR) repeat protein
VYQGRLHRRLPSDVRFNIERVLCSAADIGLAICVFVTPLMLGGRHDAGRLVYLLGAGLAAIGTFGRVEFRRGSVSIPCWLLATLAGAVALVGLQVLPATFLVDWFGPDLSKILPMWGESGYFGAWKTLSLTPGASREGLALLLAHALLLISLVVRLDSYEEITRCMRWVAAAALGMTLIAFLQYALPNGKVLWVYSHPHRDFDGALQGAFANKNHFAHFVLLGLGPVVWLASLQRKRSGSHRAISFRAAFGLCVVAMIVAVFVSQSRGAVVALMLATLCSFAVGWRGNAIGGRHVIALSLLTLGGFAGVTMFGYDRVSKRTDDLLTANLEQLDAEHSRRSIWEANLKAFQASPWVGFGAGSHPEVYPLFLEAPTTREFTHAESGYLQIASENGLAGLLLLATMLGGVAAACVRGISRVSDEKTAILWAAIVASLIASAVHSAVDFVWYLPGLLSVTIALMACAIQLERLTRKDAPNKPPSRTRQEHHFLMTGMATALGCFAVVIIARPAFASTDWDKYLRVSMSLRSMVERQAVQSGSGDDSLYNETVATCSARMVELLRDAITTDPNNARARLRLARKLLQVDAASVSKSDPPMTLELIRDAAVHGGFEKPAEMRAWFDRVFSTRVANLQSAYDEAMTAVRMSPLQGEGYLCLASLGFLDPTGPETSDCVDQALAVRPYDGQVLFEAGREYWIEGRHQEGVELWRQSIRRPGNHQAQLIAVYASFATAADMIEQLDPGPDATAAALKIYSRLEKPSDLGAICDHAMNEARREEAAGDATPLVIAERWRQVSATLRLIERGPEAVAAAEHAAEIAPQWFPIRIELAAAYRSVEKFDEADPHIRWCLARRPDIRHLHVWLEESAKRRTGVDRNRRERLSQVANASKASGRTTDPRDDEPQPAQDSPNPVIVR